MCLNKLKRFLDREREREFYNAACNVCLSSQQCNVYSIELTLLEVRCHCRQDPMKNWYCVRLLSYQPEIQIHVQHAQEVELAFQIPMSQPLNPSMIQTILCKYKWKNPIITVNSWTRQTFNTRTLTLLHLELMNDTLHKFHSLIDLNSILFSPFVWIADSVRFFFLVCLFHV